MVLAVLAGLLLSACSTAIPLPAFISKEDVTGSIARFVSPISEKLDPEDWRQAQAALGTALESQDNGQAVAWDNPQSGRGGAIIPVGQAYPQEGRLCRAFMAEIGTKETVQGTGCRNKRGEWAVVEARPLRQG
jgi:surface antigen